MPRSHDEARRLREQIAARYPLADRTLNIAGRVWTVTAVPNQGPLLARVETEQDLEAFPYGLLLWPAAIALAEFRASNPALVAGRRVLELGAGVGLSGLVAQSLGAAVAQTDYQADVLALARLNAMQNGIEGITPLEADWRRFPTLPPFEVVIGSDVLYERSLHGPLLDVFDTVLAPDGLLLLSDPIRPPALEFADTLEQRGWRVQIESRLTAWDGKPKEIALFRALRPRH